MSKDGKYFRDGCVWVDEDVVAARTPGVKEGEVKLLTAIADWGVHTGVNHGLVAVRVVPVIVEMEVNILPFLLLFLGF